LKSYNCNAFSCFTIQYDYARSKYFDNVPALYYALTIVEPVLCQRNVATHIPGTGCLGDEG